MTVITKFILKNINCEACIKVSQMQIKKIAGVLDVRLVRHGSEADGELEANRDVSLTEVKEALSGTTYEVSEK